MRDKENEHLILEIKVIHGKSRKTYGSPRIVAELRASGIKVRQEPYCPSYARERTG
jgi:hypothetical protein